MPKWMRPLMGILIALAGLFLVLKIPKPARKTSVGTLPASVKKIQIDRPALHLLLQKSGEAWQIREPVRHPADPEAVREVLSSLRSLSIGEPLTQRAESHPLYDVTDSSGITVRVWGDEKGEPVSWLFGKMAPDFSHIYVRIPRKPEVYLAQGPQRYDLEKPLKQWRDRQIMRLAANEKPIRLQIRQEKMVFEIQRSSDKWMAGNQIIDEQKMEGLISSLRVMSADDFIDPPESLDLKKLGLDAPRESLQIDLDSEKSIRLSSGKKDLKQNRIPLQREGESALFWVSDYSWDVVRKAPLDLLPSHKTASSKPS